MVKNNMSNSTHSLRGSVSSLSLRQAAPMNAELERARQIIKELEETNAALERENEQARVAQPTLYKPEQMRDLPDTFTLEEKTKWEAGLRNLYTHMENNPEGSETYINAKRKVTEFSKTLAAKIEAQRNVEESKEGKVDLQFVPEYTPPAGARLSLGSGLPISRPSLPATSPYAEYRHSGEWSAVPSRPNLPAYSGYQYQPANQSTTAPQIPSRPAYQYKTYPEQQSNYHEASPRPLSLPPPKESPDFHGVTYKPIGYKRGEGYKMSDDTAQDLPGKSLFEKYKESMERDLGERPKSLITNGLLKINEQMGKTDKKVEVDNSLKDPGAYAQPFCEFLTENPTVWHAVSYFEEKLDKAGFKKLSERKTWNDELVTGGKYYIARNGSSLIAFTVGTKYKSGNGVAMVGGHVDALTARLKPISNKKTSAGYVQLGVAPYAGALNSTWWDRDLGIGGRVLVKDAKTGKITTKLVKLGWPIAKIPTLAPHFGIGMTGQENKETQTVPIIGLDNDHASSSSTGEFANLTLGSAGSFAATQPPKLVRAIAGELSITDYSSIVNWELELYDTQPAQSGGLEKEFIFGGRIDDKVCSWAAMEGLLAASQSPAEDDGIVKLVGVFDDEEIGSLLRQGAKGNFLPSVIERITETFAPSGTLSGANLLSQTYANSFLISADVTHAVNPNFLGSYLENHAPRLNTGLVICADSNGHMTTDSVSTALLTRIAEKSDNKLQLFMIRNDSRSGGTIGPSLSSMMGVRAIDAGIPQLSMHSIRATIGNLDPGLGARTFAAFFKHFEAVDREFE